jgi:adenylate cyclase
VSDAAEGAIARERSENASRIAKIRLVGSLVWACAALLFGWRPQLPWILAYYMAALLGYYALRRRPQWSLASLWAIPALDLPILFAAQFAALHGTVEEDGYVVAMSIALASLVVGASAVALRPGLTIAVAAVAVGLQAAMVVYADPARWPRLIGAVIVIGTTAAVGVGGVRQVRRLVAAAVREQEVRSRLQRYFSPAVAQAIIEEGEGRPQGDRSEITVLVADIRGFTALAAAHPPDLVVQWLDAFFARSVEVIFRHGGTLDKFLGDGVLAWFGAPLSQADHAARAVRCALELAAVIDTWNAERARLGQPVLRVGLGVHSGEAIVGDIGPAIRREYTAIGDTVNVAARLEGLTKDVGVALLVSESARRAAGDGFSWLALPDQHIRGRESPLAVWSVAPAEPTSVTPGSD